MQFLNFCRKKLEQHRRTFINTKKVFLSGHILHSSFISWNPFSLLLIFAVMLVSCDEIPLNTEKFEFFLNEKCMIVNVEQDNTIEGTYLRVKSGGGSSVIEIDFPDTFSLNEKNCVHWMIGWGRGKALFDAGCENLRTIKSLNNSSKTIEIGDLLRGSGYPETGQRIVFWNRSPSSFVKEEKNPLVNTLEWPEFVGKSVGFSAIVFDSLTAMWTMLIHEEDTNQLQIYAAVSTDLMEWKPANAGKPVLTAGHFVDIAWAGKNKKGKGVQSAMITDVCRWKGKWYLFMDGYDSIGTRSIGVAIAENSVLGPYTILPDPVIRPVSTTDWNIKSCFYAKVGIYKDNFIMYFDAITSEGTEKVGMATSKNGIDWSMCNRNPVIDHHAGWRSSPLTSEPVYFESHGDTILLLVAGAKEFKMGFWHHYITGKMYKDKSGNVNDTEWGVFLSTNAGKTFIPHENNPVFVNDYSDENENDHLGGNFEHIQTDSAEYIFYQAKSVKTGNYNIFYRIRRK